MSKLRIGAIASGSGSNFEAIIQSCESGILKDKASVEVLICNKAGAFCIERAKNHDIPYELIESEFFNDQFPAFIYELSCYLSIKWIFSWFFDQSNIIRRNQVEFEIW